ncbi:hypothetical protein COOONC_28015 [Cooperia oncophora]
MEMSISVLKNFVGGLSPRMQWTSFSSINKEKPELFHTFFTIFVLDPVDKKSRNLMKVACSLFEHEVPLRIGISFAPRSKRAVNGIEDAGIAVLNLFNFLAVDNTYYHALRTIVEVGFM